MVYIGLLVFWNLECDIGCVVVGIDYLNVFVKSCVVEGIVCCLIEVVSNMGVVYYLDCVSVWCIIFFMLRFIFFIWNCLILILDYKILLLVYLWEGFV